MSTQLLEIVPETYSPHLLHTQQRDWAETNCYVDVWIELLHALGFEPLSALAFTVGIDFEGDQFTFFKFPHADLRELFGLDVQELALWRPLVDHVREQIDLGRPVLVELDSFYLPDTAGTAYRAEHVKSTVAAVEIDIECQRLSYFHGQGFYQLAGDDFVNVFRLNVNDPRFLPPYVEIVKRPRRWLPAESQLVETSWDQLLAHVERLPEENPFAKFKARFESDLDWLLGSPLEVFHQYSFATLRQFGACYEMAANYFRWLESHDVPGLGQLITDYATLSTAAKTMQFQLARAMARKKRLALTGLDDMAATWQNAVNSLRGRVARPMREFQA